MKRLRVPCLLESDLASEARYQPRVNHARPVLRPVQPLNSALPGAGVGTDRPDRSADKGGLQDIEPRLRQAIIKRDRHDKNSLAFIVTVTHNTYMDNNDGAAEMTTSTRINWTITRTGGRPVEWAARSEQFQYERFDHLDAPTVLPNGSCKQWNDDQRGPHHGANLIWSREQ